MLYLLLTINAGLSQFHPKPFLSLPKGPPKITATAPQGADHGAHWAMKAIITPIPIQEILLTVQCVSLWVVIIIIPDGSTNITIVHKHFWQIDDHHHLWERVTTDAPHQRAINGLTPIPNSWSPNSDLEDNLLYPLVNVYITMERSITFHGKTHYKLWFSIVMLNYKWWFSIVMLN